MPVKTAHTILRLLIMSVWLLNGLFCKVLQLVPRHAAIVQRILQVDKADAASITLLIGISEILMALWILSRIQERLNAITQILIIACMNSLEFVLAPDLLLWGRYNALFALLLIGLIYYNEFVLNRKPQHV